MWIISLFILTLACILVLVNSFYVYFSYPIVTNVYTNNHDKEAHVFPAVIFCNHFESSLYPDEFLAKLIFQYEILKPSDYCTRFNMSFGRENGFLKCSKINGGKNLGGHAIDLLITTRVGKDEGLAVYFDTNSIFKDRKITPEKGGKLFHYFIGYNYVHPSAVEMNGFILFMNEQANVAMVKSVSQANAWAILTIVVRRYICV